MGRCSSWFQRPQSVSHGWHHALDVGSAANQERFGAQSYASGKVACYPQVCTVTLTSIQTPCMANIAFGCYDTNQCDWAG